MQENASAINTNVKLVDGAEKENENISKMSKVCATAEPAQVGRFGCCILFHLVLHNRLHHLHNATSGQ